MDDKVILSGARIKEARERLQPKLIQEDAAKKMGITRVTYIGWEKAGELRLSLHDAQKVAKVLKVDIADLKKKEGAGEVNTVNESSIDYGKAFDKYDQLYKEVVKSKERHLEDKDRQLSGKEEEVKRLNDYNLFLQETVRELTKGFASLKKI
jgi:transcriptional regulator with XRE-family HTH domain